MEIERKFLIRKLPDNLGQFPIQHVSQGYLVVGGDREERVRRISLARGEACFHTIKEGSGRKRLEHEREIDEQEFSRLWSKTQGRGIYKSRYKIPYDYVFALVLRF